VDTIVSKAKAAGATVAKEAEDLGFMYSQGFQDLDGHNWDFFWMNPEKVQK